MVNQTADRVARGMTIVGELEEKFKAIQSSLVHVNEMTGKIGETAGEQEHGIAQVNQAMGQVDRHAKETANEAGSMTRISTDIAGEVENLHESVRQLGGLINQ